MLVKRIRICITPILNCGLCCFVEIVKLVLLRTLEFASFCKWGDFLRKCEKLVINDEIYLIV